MEQDIRNLAVGKDYLVYSQKANRLKGIVTCCRSKATKSKWYATEFYRKGEKIYKPFYNFMELINYIREIAK